MGSLPSGTVTFLFTDIENSTSLWEKHPEAMKPVLEKHDSLLKEAVQKTISLEDNLVGNVQTIWM
jgi:class 3 adenylate cyclase